MFRNLGSLFLSEINDKFVCDRFLIIEERIKKVKTTENQIIDKGFLDFKRICEYLKVIEDNSKEMCKVSKSLILVLLLKNEANDIETLIHALTCFLSMNFEFRILKFTGCLAKLISLLKFYSKKFKKFIIYCL